MELIAIKSVKHAGVRYEPDEPFTANARDGRILVAIGKARLGASTDDDNPRQQETSEGDLSSKSKSKSGKGKYKRRDMTAEQSGD